MDLLAVLPFYLSVGGLDLRALRAFRFFRLVRVLKLLRYHRALEHFKRTFRSMREELVLFLAACTLLVYLASVGIYYFEREAQPEAFGSVFSSMWWAVATLTTVGYGDAYPVTIGGRLFTTFILVIGLGIVAVPAGLISSALQRAMRNEEPKRR